MSFYTKYYPGKCAYTSPRKVNQACVEITIKSGKYGPVLSMTGYIHDPFTRDHAICGQCLDTILEQFPTDTTLIRLVHFWRKYHLNDMNAGTIRQTEAIEAWKQLGNAYDYGKACEYLKSIDLYEDKQPDFDINAGFPDEVLQGKRGYKYGEAWLYYPVSEADMKDLKELLLSIEQEINPSSNKEFKY